jgi:hypothetical protein
MTRKTNESQGAGTPDPVIVVYEDVHCQTEAVKFCDALVRRFWPTHGIDVRWCSFSMLQEPAAAADSAEQASRAPFILFAMQPQGELPIDVALWIQKWSSKRKEREGVLIGLLDPGAAEGRIDEKHLYLRNMAHRAGLDYVTKMPETISMGIPDSLESYSQRADRVTSVLDEILQNQPPRPGVVIPVR